MRRMLCVDSCTDVPPRRAARTRLPLGATDNSSCFEALRSAGPWVTTVGTLLARSRVSVALLAGLMLLVVGASSASAQTTVTATWDRNTDTYTAGYRVYYGTAPGSYQWSLDAGNQVSAPVNLSPGSLYYFSVRAY